MTRAGDPLDAGDNEVLTRARLEAAAERAGEFAAAVDLVEASVSEVPPRDLARYAERLGRAYALVLARLRREERRAVQTAVAAAKAVE
jgi:hypothetical protein